MKVLLSNIIHHTNGVALDTGIYPTHPTIADPETTAVNQAFLTYEGVPDTSVSVGRKAFNFDNMRFVNQNNWRQGQVFMILLLWVTVSID